MQIFVTHAKPVIECIRCGIQVEAGNMSIGHWVHTMDEIHRIIASRMPEIPVGWSSNGWKGNQRDLRCKGCTAP
ncbi:hypothetical protein [Rhizobium arsenicireducens]